MLEIIFRQEERLRRAQLSGDVAELGKLISDDLQFVFYNGAIFNKQMDLEAHRSGDLKIHAIEMSEQKIQIFGEAAVVTVRAKITATFSGQHSEGEFRYIRTWVLRDHRWQIIAGAVTQILE